MKVTNILHTLGAIGCIGGIVGTSHMGWNIWQWPVISLLWLISSWFSTLTYRRYQKLSDELDMERRNLVDKLHKADTRAWDAEMNLAQFAANNQINGIKTKAVKKK